MHKPPFPYVLLLCIAGISLFGLNSCKEDTILDANVVPVGDTVNILRLADTFTVLTKTVFDDSIATSFSVSGVPIYHAVGRLSTDLYSGNTEAGIYLQVIPPSTGYKFPKAIDSAVLILPYGGFAWGDTISPTPQTFKVYEVTESLSKDSTYYSFTNKQVNESNVLGEVSNVTYQSIKDSITVNGISRYPHLRIPLTNSFKDRIVNEAANGTGVNSFAEFLNYFKGLYIKSDATTASTLYYFLLNGGNDFTRANIQFFYTDKTSSNQDTVKYASFFFDQTQAAHYNKIGRDYNTSLTQPLFSSSAPSDRIFVIQNEPGASLDIRMPFVKHLPKQPIIKAELIITQQKGEPGDDPAKYWAPQRLFPVGVYSGGGAYTIQDRFPLNSSEPLIFMDGRRRDVTINGSTYSQYVINIPRELQKAIVEQRDTLHLRINGTTQYPGAYRLIGGGRDLSSPTGVRLNIVYSKI